MKVLGISCSPRKGGNTEILMQEALAGARDSEAETELFSVVGKDIKPCDGCLSCEKTGECKIKDDMQPLYEKMLSADGIILGTPVYFYSMSGQAKVLLDRTYALLYPRIRLANKVASGIAVTARAGAASALHTLYFYFLIHHMFSAEWVEGLAREKGEITKDERAMKAAYELGREVVTLIKQHRFPEEYDARLTTLVKRKYKTGRYPKQ